MARLLSVPDKLRTAGEDFAALAEQLHGLVVELVLDAVGIDDAEQGVGGLVGKVFGCSDEMGGQSDGAHGDHRAADLQEPEEEAIGESGEGEVIERARIFVRQPDAGLAVAKRIALGAEAFGRAVDEAVVIATRPFERDDVAHGVYVCGGWHVRHRRGLVAKGGGTDTHDDAGGGDNGLTLGQFGVPVLRVFARPLQFRFDLERTRTKACAEVHGLRDGCASVAVIAEDTVKQGCSHNAAICADHIGVGGAGLARPRAFGGGGQGDGLVEYVICHAATR